MADYRRNDIYLSLRFNLVKLPNDYIDKIKSGDELSFRDFIKSHSSHLFYYALGLVKLKEPAEEIVSDVFLEVWKIRHSIDEIRNIRAWMLVTTYRKSVSYLRRESGKQNLSFDEIDYCLFAPMQSPDEEMISKEEMVRINEAIGKLPPKCKHVFFLAKIEGLPYAEIADMLNISVKTINNHIAYAVDMIAKNLNIPAKRDQKNKV